MTAIRARGLGAGSIVLIGTIRLDPVTPDPTAGVAALDDAVVAHAPLLDRFARPTIKGEMV